MSQGSINPYAAPSALEPALLAAPASANPWKSIARRWEWLRAPYNALVGLTGIVALAASGAPLPWFDTILGAAFYGLAANVFYLFGPIAEMYVNWIADLGEQRFLPRGLVWLIRSSLVTWTLFLAGTGFSILLTLAFGLSVGG